MSAPDLSSTKWITSSYSAGNGACVEVAPLAGDVGVRDSKDRRGPVLTFGSDAWRAFVADLPDPAG